MTNHAAGEPAERDMFEAWARANIRFTGQSDPCERWTPDPSSKYVAHDTNMTWAAWQARAALNAPAAVELTSEAGVCAEILSIMEEYDRQEKEHGCVDTPGGLEHMGDVWRLFESWRDRLTTKEPK
jgi:hypothetical protein